jgi:hypothetical protein
MEKAIQRVDNGPCAQFSVYTPVKQNGYADTRDPIIQSWDLSKRFTITIFKLYENNQRVETSDEK